jgi:hypothetical protein
MTAELRLVLAGKEARLFLKIHDQEIEDELWKFDRKLTKAEIEEITTCVFQDAYSVIQYAAHEQ